MRLSHPADLAFTADLLDALEELAAVFCLHDGTFDSMANSTYADAIELLARAGRLEITERRSHRWILARRIPASERPHKGSNHDDASR